MKTWFVVLIFVPLWGMGQIYFPPNNSTTWDTLGLSELGWCDTYVDTLYDYLETNNTKAFILMKDGKIVLEQYFDGFQADDFWYWASAGKTMTAFSIGLTQQQGALNINDTTSDYLGLGWTDCTPAQEEKITIRHQLTMTTGLDDAAEFECTDDTCLTYLADPGTRWAYHNGPYTLLTEILEQATGTTDNLFVNQYIKNPTGMDGFYIDQGYNRLFTSTPRSMARFSLLMLNNGNWDGTPVMTDLNYFNDMISTSQNLNEAYGYLWWLNGKNTFMLPSSQVVFPGKLCVNAPDDMYAALGKNGQFINVVPSEGLTWIRMGNAPNNLFVPYLMNDEIWERLNLIMCGTNAVNELEDIQLIVSPNPVRDFCEVKCELSEPYNYQLLDMSGRVLREENELDAPSFKMDMRDLESGFYLLNIESGGFVKTIRLVKAN